MSGREHPLYDLALAPLCAAPMAPPPYSWAWAPTVGGVPAQLLYGPRGFAYRRTVEVPVRIEQADG